MPVGSAEYLAEPLKKIAEYSVSAKSHFGWFGRGSVSAKPHFGWFGAPLPDALLHFCQSFLSRAKPGAQRQEMLQQVWSH